MAILPWLRVTLTNFGCYTLEIKMQVLFLIAWSTALQQNRKLLKHDFDLYMSRFILVPWYVHHMCNSVLTWTLSSIVWLYWVPEHSRTHLCNQYAYKRVHINNMKNLTWTDSGYITSRANASSLTHAAAGEEKKNTQQTELRTNIRFPSIFWAAWITEESLLQVPAVQNPGAGCLPVLGFSCCLLFLSLILKGN